MKPTIELIKSQSLPDFPSGSSINFYKGSLYLIGDDAKDILVLDRQYNPRSTIHLFDDPNKRIPKPIKQDFETSTVVRIGEEDYLLVLGSSSRSNRTKGLLISLKEESWPGSTQYIDYQEFIDRIKAIDVGEINIEGCAEIGRSFVLSNRANSKNSVNTLITTAGNFWSNQGDAELSISNLKLPMKGEETIGVSELCYEPSIDILLITLSTEVTDNAYEDGAIGDSYVGWIKNIRTKIGSSVIELDGMINLSDCHEDFKDEKIEGLCVESVVDNVLLIHLVSDDDKGHSKLFKARLSF